jgi:hypothetical protein
MQLDLKGDMNHKFRDLTTCVASSLVSTHEAVQNANQAAEHLGSRLAIVNHISQAIRPLATEIMAQFNAWQPSSVHLSIFWLRPFHPKSPVCDY